MRGEGRRQSDLGPDRQPEREDDEAASTEPVRPLSTARRWGRADPCLGGRVAGHPGPPRWQGQGQPRTGWWVWASQGGARGMPLPGWLPTSTPPTSSCPSYKASREEGPPLLPETSQDEDGPAAPRCTGCGRRARWVRARGGVGSVDMYGGLGYRPSGSGYPGLRGCHTQNLKQNEPHLNLVESDLKYRRTRES